MSSNVNEGISRINLNVYLNGTLLKKINEDKNSLELCKMLFNNYIT